MVAYSYSGRQGMTARHESSYIRVEIPRPGVLTVVANLLSLTTGS